MKKAIFSSFLISILFSCNLSRSVLKDAHAILINDSALQSATIGISIYEPTKNKVWLNYNADHFFVPASNTKLFTLYAAMKFLGDSLLGIRYEQRADTLYIEPTGDPTFFHPDFMNQPVDFLLQKNSSPIVACIPEMKSEKYGPGWSWDDLNDYYAAQRNQFPVFGNTIQISAHKVSSGTFHLDKAVPLIDDSCISIFSAKDKTTTISRSVDNHFQINIGNGDSSINLSIPFETNGVRTALDFIIKKYVAPVVQTNDRVEHHWKSLYTQPTDSVLMKMMHASDNFLAEQLLLMTSYLRFGNFDSQVIIDALIKTELKKVPSVPVWEDGSGLSRYNLFTPNDFIFILDKLDIEFGKRRIRSILPSGGEGTLKQYFISDSTNVYAKTGTLSHVVALSGFMTTQKGNELIFSILVNNSNVTAKYVRRAVEKFIKKVRSSY